MDMHSPFTDSQFCLVLFLFTFLLYGNTLYSNAGYVWDDRAAILSNRDVSAADHISNVFHNDFWGQNITFADSHKSYRPVTVLTFRFNHWLHGFAPSGFHAFNIFIYATGVVVFYFWACLWSSRPVSRVAALLFCSHPVHVEAVSSIVGRADALCGLFYLAAIYLYTCSNSKCAAAVNFADPFSSTAPRQSIFIFASFLTAVLSAFSKEVGITVFGFFICLEMLDITCVTVSRINQNPGRDDFSSMTSRIQKFKNLSEQLISTACARFQGIARILISLTVLLLILLHRRSITNGTLYKWTVLENHVSLLPDFKSRSLSYAQTHFWYMFKLIYPRYLCFDYGFSCLPLVHQYLDLRNICPLLVYLSFILLTAYSLLQMKVMILVSLLLIILPLLPALNVLFPVGTVLAERLLFLPSAGYCLILAEMIKGDFLTDRMPILRTTKKVAPASLKSCLKNNSTAKKCIVKIIKFSEKENIHVLCKSKNTGFLRAKKIAENKQKKVEEGQYLEMERERARQKSALERTADFIYPHFSSLFTLLVCSLYAVRVVTRTSDWVTEIKLYKSALSVCPLSVKALTNYGTLALDEGKIPEAISAGQQSISVLFHQRAAHINLGLAFERDGQFVRSIRSFETAFKMYPQDPKIHECLGRVLALYSTQMDLLKEQEGSDVKAEMLSVSLKKQAMQFMDATINLRYSTPSTLHARGSMALDDGDYPLALSLLLKALQQNEANKDSILLKNETLDESNTLNQLGNVYLHLRQPDNAVDAFEKGVKISPGNMALRTNLGGLYRSLGKRDRARVTMEQGLALCDWGEDTVTYATLANKTAIDLQPDGTQIAAKHILKGTSSPIKPPAALLNNLGLIELEDGNYQVALFLFERAAELCGADQGEMRSEDGDSALSTMKRNVEKARETLLQSAISLTSANR